MFLLKYKFYIRLTEYLLIKRMLNLVLITFHPLKLYYICKYFAHIAIYTMWTLTLSTNILPAIACPHVCTNSKKGKFKVTTVPSHLCGFSKLSYLSL